MEQLFRYNYRPLCLYALHYIQDPDKVEDVARDESRPFEISAGNSYVKVLGTSFQVDAPSGKAVEVYVASGKVFFPETRSRKV